MTATMLTQIHFTIYFSDASAYFSRILGVYWAHLKFKDNRGHSLDSEIGLGCVGGLKSGILALGGG